MPSHENEKLDCMFGCTGVHVYFEGFVFVSHACIGLLIELRRETEKLIIIVAWKNFFTSSLVFGLPALKEKFGLFVDFEFLTEMGSLGTD